MAQSDESALLVRMEASLAKFERQMQAGYAAAEKYANATEKRLGNMGKNVAKSAESSAAVMAKELDALRAKYDPLFAASKQYEAELAQVDRAWKLGAITAAQHGAAIERLNAQYLVAQNVTNDLGDAALRGGDKMRMAAMQLSQVGQQTMASGNFIQALAIQLPDLGLAFGAVGAAAGLLGGVALPMLYQALTGNGEAARIAAEQAERLQRAYDGAAEAARSQQVEIDKLRFGVDEEYQVELLREKAKIEREINLAVADGNTRIAEASNSLDRQRMIQAEVQANVSALAARHAEITGLLNEQADRAATYAVVQGVVEQRAAETAARLREGEAAASGIASSNMSGTIAAAASSAAQLAQNLGVSLSIAQRMMAGGYVGAKAPVLDPRDPHYDKGAAARATNFGFEHGTYSPPVIGAAGGGSKRGGAKGGSGGKAQESIFKTTEDDLQRIQREIELLGRSKGEVARLKAEWALLDKAKERGLDLDKAQAGSSKSLREEIEAQSKAVADLTMQLDRQKLSQEMFEKGIDGIAGAMSEALVNGQSLRAGLADVFRSIAMDLAKSGIKEMLSSLFNGGGGGGGFLGGILGGIFGGTPSFDGGGWTGNGARAGGIDGKGGFPAILHPRETVVDTTKGNGGGAGALRVTVTMDPSTGGLGAFVTDAANRVVAKAAPAIMQQSVKAAAAASHATKGTMRVR